jgi:transcriptional antiterminator NusG
MQLISTPAGVPPILSFPPTLPSANSLIETSWFALRVRSKSETGVASLLGHKGYETFNPTYAESRKYSDRIRRLHRAIFPGYVFCRFHPDHTLPILSTAAVLKILTISGRPAAISEAEIENARRAATSASARPHPYLDVGQKVRVIAGPLMGVEGFLVALQGSKKALGDSGTPRLVISADLLQRSLSVEIDSFDVVPV